MRRRHLYVLLFALPALLVSIMLALLAFGAAAGALWLFVFGDNPWPAAAGTGLAALFAAACLAVWIALLRLAYAAGRKEEARPSLNPAHLLAALLITAGAIAVMVLHQRSVGNLGPQSDGAACAAYCQARGFAGSGMPPRNAALQTCSCYDAQGREAVTVPMGEVAAPQRK